MDLAREQRAYEPGVGVSIALLHAHTTNITQRYDYVLLINFFDDFLAKWYNNEKCSHIFLALPSFYSIKLPCTDA